MGLDVVKDFIMFLLHLLSTLDVMWQLGTGQMGVHTACPQHLVTYDIVRTQHLVT